MKALFINAQPDDLVVKVGTDTELKPISQGTGRMAIANPDRLAVPIRVEAPTLPTEKIALLKGTYTILGSTRTLSFTFDLDKPRPQSRSQDGVTASLHEFKQTKSMIAPATTVKRTRTATRGFVSST